MTPSALARVIEEWAKEWNVKLALGVGVDLVGRLAALTPAVESWEKCIHGGPLIDCALTKIGLPTPAPAQGEDCGCNQEGEHGPNCPPWCDKRPTTPPPTTESR